MLTFTPKHFVNIKSFICYLCQETGLTDAPEVAQSGRPNYLLMLDDSVLLNMASIRDNDRLSLIPSFGLG